MLLGRGPKTGAMLSHVVGPFMRRGRMHPSRGDHRGDHLQGWAHLEQGGDAPQQGGPQGGPPPGVDTSGTGPSFAMCRPALGADPTVAFEGLTQHWRYGVTWPTPESVYGCLSQSAGGCSGRLLLHTL